MSPRTLFLAKLIGLYCILTGLSMIMRKQVSVAIVVALVHSPPVLYILGVMLVLAGLALILSHNVWSGGALQVVVTLVGWLALMKGLFLMFVPPDAAAGFYLGAIHYEQLFYLYAAIPLVLGIYLTYGGFRSL